MFKCVSDGGGAHFLLEPQADCPNSIPTMSQKFYMLSPNGVI